MTGKLIILGTPIGNLGDISPRAIETLKNTDFIAAEDTRVTIKLLNHFEIKKPLISYYKHNKNFKGGVICERILNGETCVLVSDAGMPAISDPGEDLVRECADLGIPVSVVPGPSALVCALAVSGLPTGRFTFEGFLTVNKKNRKKHLEELVNETRTMVFYEAPHKLLNTLTDFLKIFGDRKICIVKELTKIHEDILRTSISKALEIYSEINKPKGEYVLILEGAKKKTEKISLKEASQLAKELVNNGFSASQAAKQISKQTGLKKSDIYNLI